MAPRRPSLRTTVLVLAGVAGVVLAHGLDYLLIFRSPAQRAAELAETGHGWWPAAVGAALAAACLSVAMATARGATGALFRRAAGSAGTPVGRDLASVALWQAGVFAALEVLERIGAHRSPLDLLHGPLFAVGLLLQVVVAAGVVAALRAVERAGASVAGGAVAAARRAGRARPRSFGVAPAAAGGGRPVPGRHGARGPPLGIAA